jgi:hypothetical protein
MNGPNDARATTLTGLAALYQGIIDRPAGLALLIPFLMPDHTQNFSNVLEISAIS